MAASACIVSVLCFYIYIYISIILLKKRQNHSDPFLGQGYGWGYRGGSQKGLGQLVQGGTFLLDISADMPSQA